MAEATVWTVNKILQWTQQYFAGKGLESPRLDAEVLLCDVLGCRRIDLFMRLQQELTEEELHIYHDLVVRRAAGDGTFGGKTDPLPDGEKSDSVK